MTAGAVASPHAGATDAGIDSLRQGGNAIDAALATAAALTVSYPHNNALGGDLFALVHRPDGEVVAFNASGRAPQASQGGPTVIGPGSITTPGLVAGWGALHAAGARRPWGSALEAAITMADTGVPVAPGLASAVAETPGVLRDPGMSQVFTDAGRLLDAGDVLRQPALSRTLQAMQAGGWRVFYEGDIAQALVNGLQAAGSHLSLADFEQADVEQGDALRCSWRGLELCTAAPNSSGVLLLQALLAADRAELADPLGEDAGVLGRILDAGNAQRDADLCDPWQQAFDRERWLGDQRIGQIAEDALAARATGPATVQARPTGDTVAVVASDVDGWGVSLIQSVFHQFGSQLLEPTTGVLFHNRGAGFSTVAGHPNAQRPGRRPAHSLMPVLVRRDGRLAGVLGTMGGKIQAQIHAQLLLRLTAGGNASEAVRAPRFGIGAMEVGEALSTVRVEADCSPEARESIVAAGFDAVEVPAHSDYLGHSQVIWLDEGQLDCASDPRADGAARMSE